MTFHRYPDTAGPLTTFAKNATRSTTVVELTSPVNGLDTMFVTVALSGENLVAVPAAIDKPTISLGTAGGGPTVAVVSTDDINPTAVAGGDAYATVFNEGNGVYRVQIYKYNPTVLSWVVDVTNQDADPVKMTLVVADTASEARKSWVEVPAAVNWDTEVGPSLTTQEVPLTIAVGNRGSGPLTIGAATGVIASSNFTVAGKPASIAPGTTGDLKLTYKAPAASGADAGVVLDLATNDPEAAAASPTHPVKTSLSASRGKLEVMLLLDASGSMGYQPNGTVKVADSDTRWAKLAVAAEQFLHLLGDHCKGMGRLGVTVFPNILSSQFPPEAPSPSAEHLAAPADITDANVAAAVSSLHVKHPPQPFGGATPIGYGIGHTMGSNAGSWGDYESSPASVEHNQRIMVLMSDGAWNSGEHPSVYWRTNEGDPRTCTAPGTAGDQKSFTDKGVRVITVAYGDPAVTAFEVDHALLRNIACKSGGTALDADADDSGLHLLETFRTALVKGLALDPTVDPGGVLALGAAVARHRVQVLPSDQQVSFVVDWVTERHGRIRLDLLTPDCELISSAQDPPPGVSIHTHPRFVVITVGESYLLNEGGIGVAEASDQPRYGEWTLVISADLGIEDNGERYQYAVLSRSRLKLRLSTASTTYYAGDAIDLEANLRLDGAPVRDANIKLFLDTPGAAATNWLAAQPVSAEEFTAAKAAIGDIEATSIGVKSYALRQRGVRFTPLVQSGVRTMALDGDQYTLTVPGSSTPGTISFRAVATGELDGVPFRREQELQVRVGVRPDPIFTLIDVRYADGVAVIRVWPRDRYGNVLLLDPDTDPSLDIAMAGAKPVTGVISLHDGSYTRTVQPPSGGAIQVTVTVGGEPVGTARPVPPPSGLHWADRVVDHEAGGEAETGANQHADPAAVLGDPAAPPPGFLALGAAGHVTVAAGEQTVLATGDDDVNVVVADASALRSYRVQGRQPHTGRWVDLGTSGGMSASFSLRQAKLTQTTAVRVVDTSLRTREGDLSVSHAPGAQIAAIGFRKVGREPVGCLGQLLRLWELILRLFRPDRRG